MCQILCRGCKIDDGAVENFFPSASGPQPFPLIMNLESQLKPSKSTCVNVEKKVICVHFHSGHDSCFGEAIDYVDFLALYYYT